MSESVLPTPQPMEESGLSILLVERANLVFGSSGIYARPIRIEGNDGTVTFGVHLRDVTLALYDPRIASFRVNVEGDWYPVFAPGDDEAAKRRTLAYPRWLLPWVDRAGESKPVD